MRKKEEKEKKKGYQRNKYKETNTCIVKKFIEGWKEGNREKGTRHSTRKVEAIHCWILCPIFYYFGSFIWNK